VPYCDIALEPVKCRGVEHVRDESHPAVCRDAAVTGCDDTGTFLTSVL